jgi:hypothetical protein
MASSVRSGVIMVFVEMVYTIDREYAMLMVFGARSRHRIDLSWTWNMSSFEERRLAHRTQMAEQCT